MKHYYSNLIITTLIASSGVMTAEATPLKATNSDLSNYSYKVQNVSSPFNSDRMKKIMQANEMLDG